MEDELDPDTYGDDFSESGHYASASNDQEDEQHAQKVNGKVESLEMMVEELRRELLEEKAEHGKTMDLLREEAYKNKENKEALSRMTIETVTAREKDDCEETKASTLSSDNDKPKKRNSLKPEPVKPEILPEPGMSEFFCNELTDFFKFCGKKSMKMGKIAGEGEFDETYCTNALRLVRKGITSQCKRIGELEAVGAAGGVGAVAIPENEMVTRISNLQIELLIAQKAKNDVKVLKMKLMLMVEKMRNEKDIRLRNEDEMFTIKKKLLMLSDHTEKLMNHLKIEATTKLKIVETLRLSEKAGRKFQEKIGIMTRKSSAKDRLILELREGSKILEDQLRLMDEKYLELRTKLDYARESGMKKVQKAEKIARELRMKYALAGGPSILDKVPLPDIFTSGQSDTDFMDYGNSAFESYQTQGNNGHSNNNNNNYNSNNHGFSTGNSGHNTGNNTGTNTGNSSAKNRLRLGNGSNGHDSPAVVKEICLDDVLDKIRRNRGDKQQWTDDKLRNLTKSR